MILHTVTSGGAVRRLAADRHRVSRLAWISEISSSARCSVMPGAFGQGSGGGLGEQGMDPRGVSPDGQLADIDAIAA